MKRTILIAIASLGILSLAVAACSSGGGNKVEPAEWPAAVAESACSWLFTCCTDAELAEQNLTDEASCVTSVTGLMTMGMGDVNAAIANGRGVWDAGAAGKCVDKVASLGCNTGSGSNLSTLLDNCGDFYMPQQGAGDTCDPDADAECKAGLFCESDSSTCVALPGAGEACNENFSCAVGLYCDGTDCQTAKAIDADCSGNNNMECASGYCDPDALKCATAPEFCVGR